MARANPIPPFPEDIDRNDFGHFLSGLVAGEGYFLLYFTRNKTAIFHVPWAQFGNNLRADDRPILDLARSFWGCGRITKHQKKRANPAMAYRIHSVRFLNDCLIPHFERYPLRAKKTGDFLIWKEGVRLI